MFEIERLKGAAFRLANTWSFFALLCQIAALVIGVVTPARLLFGAWAPVVVVGLGYLMAILRLLGDEQKGMADAILRKTEVADGLGRPLPPRERADLLADASLVARLVAKTIDPSEGSYGNALAPSPRRLLLNTYESAWWTKRLAKDMVWLQACGIATLLGAAILVLRTALPGEGAPATVGDFSDLALAAVLFAFTQGPLRRLLAFRSLSEGAARVEARAEGMLAQSGSEGIILEADATALLSEYHLVRKGSPAIPVTWWRLRRRRLNEVAESVEAPWLVKSAGSGAIR
jgi:hypothetical protein